MADRYWVGGTGTWNSTSTTNWSASSGGASGASVPTAADNVFFNANSNVGTGSFTVTMADSPRVCNDITISGLDGAMTLAGTSIGLTVSGSLSFPATNFTRTYTGTTTFNATTTGKTITTNGVSFSGTVTLNGVGGAWTLGSALNTGGFTLILTNGTFDTSSAGNYSVTAGNFSSSNSNTRTINLNGSTLSVSASSSWNMSTSTSATVNAGTSTINLSGTASEFFGGGLTYYNVSFTSVSATVSVKQITGANTFNNLTFSTPSSNANNNFSIGANQTINGTLTASGSNISRRIFVRSDTVGTSRTLTCAAIASMTDVDFRDITIAGAHGTLSGTRLGNCNGNSNITFDAGVDKYWNLAAGGNWSATAWALSSGGGVAAANFPLAQDTVIIENTGLNTSATVTIDVGYNIGTLDTSTRTNAMTLASGTTSPSFYGNFTYGSGVTPTGTGTYTFSNRSTKTLNSGGKTFTQPVTIDAPGGGIQLLTNNLTLGSTLTTTLTQGTLDLNNLVFTTGLFLSSNSNTRTIAFGTGNISCSGTGAVWGTGTVTGLTTTGTQVVNVTSSGSTAIFIGTGALSEANSISFNFTGGTYALTLAAGSNFRNLNFTGYAGTLQATSAMSVFGNLTISTGMSLTASSSTMTFASTSGTRTITTNGKTMDFPVTFDGVGGTWQLQDNMTVGSTRTCTLTNGTIDLFNNTLSTGIFSSTNSNTRSIAFGTGGITVTTATAGSTVLSMATATNFTFTGTSNISAAMSVTRTFNFGGTAGATTSNRLNINLTSGSSVPTFTGSFRQINFTGSTSNPGAVTISCHGFTLASGGTYTSTDFTTVGDGTLTYTGKAIDILNINTTGITTTLADAGQNVTTTLTNGTLNLAGFTLTNTTSAATATGTKNLTFNGGTFVISGSGASAWDNAAPTGFTTTAGTGTGTISMTAATAKTFVGGGSTYNCTLNQGGAGTLTITGANTFNDITNTNATASQITFPASTTTTVNAFTLSGSSGNLVSIRSSTPGTRFTLSDASGTVSVSFLDIQDSNATGGATWQALVANGNVDSGNNLGWSFSAGGYVDAIAYVNANAAVTSAASVLKFGNASIDGIATVSCIGNELFLGQASINCVATVNADGTAIISGIGSITGNATLSADAYKVISFSGSITGDASVTADAIRIRTVSGSVLGEATVSGLGNITASGIGLIEGLATVNAYGNATFFNAPTITGNATVLADGQIIGEEWSDDATTATSWGTVTTTSSVWTADTPTDSDWLRQ